MRKKQIAAVAVIVFVSLCVVLFFVLRGDTVEPVENLPDEEVSSAPEHSVIGRSVEGRPIEAYIYGQGDTHLLFVGGIHGGYEWNSVSLAYAFMDYMEEHPEIIIPRIIPENITIAVIPSLNPDGVYKVVGKEGRFSVNDAPEDTDSTGIGRFNSHAVDLNRNFDCKWQAESTWRGNTVSAGKGAFSEPESQALRDFVLEYKPSAVVFWHSQAGAVYASECEDGILPITRDIMNEYADAAKYQAVDSFDAYEITGDAEGWLASIGVPAITVELSTHETIEWEQNLAGVRAVLRYFDK
jgi:hypothetical protein